MTTPPPMNRGTFTIRVGRGWSRCWYANVTCYGLGAYDNGGPCFYSRSRTRAIEKAQDWCDRQKPTHNPSEEIEYAPGSRDGA